jgi:hypothetical protein
MSRGAQALTVLALGAAALAAVAGPASASPLSTWYSHWGSPVLAGIARANTGPCEKADVSSCTTGLISASLIGYSEPPPGPDHGPWLRAMSDLGTGAAWLRVAAELERADPGAAPRAEQQMRQAQVILATLPVRLS